MAFKTDAQRRWWFAHLGKGMRRIAGTMRAVEISQRELRQSPDYQRGMMEGGMRRIGQRMAEAAGVKATTREYWSGGKKHTITYAPGVRLPEHKPRDERADALADATWKAQHPETLNEMRASIARAKSLRAARRARTSGK